MEFGFDEDDVEEALEENEDDEIDALYQLLTGTLFSSDHSPRTRIFWIFFSLSAKGFCFIFPLFITFRFCSLDLNSDDEEEEEKEEVEITDEYRAQLKEQRDFEVLRLVFLLILHPFHHLLLLFASSQLGGSMPVDLGGRL